MTGILEALAGVSIFAVPCLVVAAVDQHKLEKERKKREFEEIRERDYLYGFKAGMRYEKACAVGKARNSVQQQVDKEEERYARMVY